MYRVFYVLFLTTVVVMSSVHPPTPLILNWTFSSCTLCRIGFI